MVTVLANGCFDLLHAGHVAHLQEARAMGDRLVVALTVDDSVWKGRGRPICRWEERAAVLRALACVDAVVPSRSGLEAVLRVRPQVFAKGPDYADTLAGIVREACAEVGAEIRFTSAPKMSTGEIIARVRACA